MLALGLLLFIALGVAFYLASRMIRIEYERHPAAWTDDGKPADYFAQVPGSYVARMAVSTAWLFTTPDWVKSELAARKLIVWYRILCFVFFSGWVVMVYLQSKRT